MSATSRPPHPSLLSRRLHAPWILPTHGGWAILAILTLGILQAADQPQWGQRGSRNMVSAESHLPAEFDPESGRNIRWRAVLGTDSYATPIVAEGHVYIGTNNERPRDPAARQDSGVLLCFEETSGRFLWQLAAPKLEGDPYYDWPKTGLSSPVTVENGRVYLVNNRAEVVCLDAHGDVPDRTSPNPVSSPASDVPGQAKVLWRLDLVSAAGIWPHDGAHSSILIDGPFLYLNSGTGVDNTHKKIRTPDAPSLVVVEKATGRLVARDAEHIAPWIFHASWSSPAMATVEGKRLVVFAGGDGVVYGFEPLTALPPRGEVLRLKKVWQFDFDPSGPKAAVHRFNGNKRESPSTIMGMPVVIGTRLYVAGGGDLWWGKNEAWLKCVDLAGAVAPGPGTHVGQLLWSAPLNRHTMSTAAVSEGLVFVTDCGRFLHCLDAVSGESLWTHEFAGDLWASPLVADGKVYVGSRKGDFSVFAADRVKRVLSTVDLHHPINGTVTAANGTLFIPTATELFAVGLPESLR